MFKNKFQKIRLMVKLYVYSLWNLAFHGFGDGNMNSVILTMILLGYGESTLQNSGKVLINNL